mgnify:CR=1 FL=1
MKYLYLNTLASILLFISMSLFSTLSAAESLMEKGMCDKDKGPKRLIKALDISESQKEDFLVVMKSQHEKRMQLHEQSRSAQREGHEEMKALHQETLEKLQPILTESQLQAFEDFTKKNRPPRKSGARRHQQDKSVDE